MKVVKYLALVLCLIVVSVSCFSCSNGNAPKKSDERQQKFIDCYNTYVKRSLVNSDTVTIKSITEDVDEKGGTLVHFTYEYTTDAGYRQQDSMYLVTSTITLDASLITLTELNQSYGDDIAKYDGKSVPAGFMKEYIWGRSTEEKILDLWRQFQDDSKYADDDAYDIDEINEGIK